jgi:hypothetical protein
LRPALTQYIHSLAREGIGYKYMNIYRQTLFHQNHPH